MAGLLGSATVSSGAKAPQASGIPDYWSQFFGGAAQQPKPVEPNWGGGGPTGPIDGLFNKIPQPGEGPILDPQMVEVAPPKMPDMARQGLMGASGAATGWGAQPTQQMSSQDIGKRIYPPGGTGLTGKRVY